MPDKGVLKTKAFGSAVQVVETAVGDCDIESVVVYQDRAEVKRAVPVHLYPGENEVIVFDLADCVDKNSIRALHVGLEAPDEVDAVLYVSYVVTNASWSSAYDIRVFTKDKNMKVQYYGLIKQQTGEDWKDVHISLSTAQPSVGGAPPQLPTRLIHFKRPPPRPVPRSGKNVWSREHASLSTGDAMEVNEDLSLALANLQRIGSEIADEIDQQNQQLSGINYKCDSNLAAKGGKRLRRRLSESPSPPPLLQVSVADVSTGLYNTNYGIPRTTTIPADNTEHKVTVALLDLSPEFIYTSVPRLSPHSFLQSKAKNTSHYAMLAGPSNIFLDNNFIAKSELSDVSPGEDFTTSLGVDQSIRITCQPIATVHHTRSGLLGGAKTNLITYTHVFQVKNTRADAVHMKLLEQLPLSTDERIKVTVQEPDLKKANTACPLPSGHALLNDSNNVEWHVEVESGAELELKLIYTVEHPTQDAVEGLPK